MPAFAAVLEVSSLNGTNGFQIIGEQVSDYSGFSVASAGDINGDGFADILIGAFGINPNYTGAAYVVFGSASGFAANLNLATLGSTAGFQISSEEEGSVFGFSVDSAGDFNGDGVDDIVIGAQFGAPNGFRSGASYVVFGKKTGLADINVSTLTGSNGFQISGEAASDYSGRCVASAGDFNGDGIDDLIIGAPSADVTANKSGSSYIVFGKPSGFAANLDLSTLEGGNGFQINGEAVAFDNSGYSVASAGDINGDGFDDVLIGTARANGSAYVVFGSDFGLSPSFNLSTLNGANGFEISNGGMDFGRSLSSAGDVNGDGLDDIIVGSPDISSGGTGSSYVVFGSASGFASSLDIATLNGSNGFKIKGEGGDDISGRSVSAAGDVNGDGIGDLIIGSPQAEPNGNNSGAAYVVFGKSSGFAAEVHLALLDGQTGFKIAGETASHRVGASVASAGDVNGDGFDDLAVGSQPASLAAGSTYIIFGHANGTLNRIGTDKADILSGGEWDDTFKGLGGADRIRSGDGDDRIEGGEGADNLEASGGDDTVLGGTGNDRINGGSGNDILSGGSGNDTFRMSFGEDFSSGGSGTDSFDFTSFSTRSINIDLSKTSFTLLSSGETQTFSSIENATGAKGKDVIVGNSFANRINGMDGDDTLSGGAGIDTISGGNGKDRITGGSGKDILSGDAGADTFVYLATSERGDTINRFAGDDFLAFKSSAFGNLAKGTLGSASFVSRASDHNAQDATDRFIYQRSDDTLWYDANGKGGVAAVLIADFSNDFNLARGDILIV